MLDKPKGERKKDRSKECMKEIKGLRKFEILCLLQITSLEVSQPTELVRVEEGKVLRTFICNYRDLVVTVNEKR